MKNTQALLPGTAVQIALLCLPLWVPTFLLGSGCDEPGPDMDEDRDGDAGGDGDADADDARDADADDARDADADDARDADVDDVPDADAEFARDADGNDGGSSDMWVTIAAGAFVMGSPLAELGREVTGGRETRHQVTLTHDFEMLSTEVTQADFETHMGYNPSNFRFCGGRCPVEGVTWYEAAAFCNELSIRAGLAQCYDCTGSGTCSQSAAYVSPYECPGYRLPTEAEWEYAARAGTTTATYNGDPDVVDECAESSVLSPIAWYCGNSGGTTHPVGSLDPNGWGLHDMLGNVYEWCHDWYVEDLGNDDVTDPHGPETGSQRVPRGGAWSQPSWRNRAAYRTWGGPDYRFNRLGFRVVRSLPRG